MSRYYNAKGERIGMWQWAESFEQERHVASTYIPGIAWISTVWLGLDHSFGDGPPLIFESMAFTWQGRESEFLGRKHFFHEELDCERYSTYAEALEGHKRMVEKFQLPLIPQLRSQNE